MARVGIVVAAVAAVGVLAAGAGFVATVDRPTTDAGAFAAPRVPAEYRDLVRAAAARCPAVPPKVFAAQLAQESSWRPDVTSPAGAQGIAQFMPATWEQYGLDANGDGRRDVWDPADAIPSAAALNCVNRDLVRAVPGDRLHNTLAAYNAGFTAVRRYRGIPPFPETEAYVARILARAEVIVL